MMLSWPHTAKAPEGKVKMEAEQHNRSPIPVFTGGTTDVRES